MAILRNNMQDNNQNAGPQGSSARQGLMMSINEENKEEDGQIQEVRQPIDFTKYTIDENLEIDYNLMKAYIERIRKNTATQLHVDYIASCLHKHKVKFEDYITTLKQVNWDRDKCFTVLRQKSELKKHKQFLNEQSEKLHQNLRENDLYFQTMALQARQLFNGQQIPQVHRGQE